ncbi:MAG TPA: DUF4197 domain-containing protein [Gammaproteobacteria bacterium]|nr:DUF4197 domain-containing protein [Gammaproteobacteria bacterium]
MHRNGWWTAAALLAVTTVAQAGWADWMDRAKGFLGQEEDEKAAEAEPAVSREDAAAGLRQALKLGAERAVAKLAREGGYLDDPAVRIPVPEALQPVAQGLRKLGQGRYADAFVESMNRAAEKAAPEAAAIFGEAAAGMTVDDAWQLLKGPDDAATRYFREHTEQRLYEAFLPIIREATASAGVTAAYKTALDYAGPYSRFVDPEKLDLDRHVTREALDGLFVKLAVEEGHIREQPGARSTELLRRVFGTGGG